MEIPGRRLFAGGVAAIFVTACLGLAAGGSHKSTERGTNLTFAYLMKFRNGDTLPAGAYRMEVPEDSQTPEVTFSQDGKVMATVKAQVVTQPKKNEDTEVDSVARGDAQLVMTIRPAGWEEKLVFGSAGQ